MTHLLITGARGVLGSYFNEGIKPDVRECDVTELVAVRRTFSEHRPEVVLHLAGITDLALCERDPAQAFLVNAVGTYHVALAAKEVGAKFVYVSTSAVFDGSKSEPYIETDTPRPLNTYAHSKYLGELAVRGLLNDFLIVRSSWLFGGGPEKDKKFVGKILAQRDESVIRAVGNRKGSPTYAKDLAAAIVKLIEENANGIVHLGTGTATRLEVAHEALALIGSSARTEEARAEEFSTGYPSGVNESMPPSPYLRPWKEALAEYVRTEWNHS